MSQALARRALAAALALVPFASQAADAPPVRVRSSAEQRSEVAITVYNQNFGLIREVRKLDLPNGRVDLEFGEVAKTIQAETVHVHSLGTADSLEVLEQNYQYDLLSPAKLLEKYIGRAVKVHRWNERLGRDEEFPAEVLATGNGTVLRIGNEITFDFPGRISFPEIPKNLIARPTLVWSLVSKKPRHDLEVSYLAGNLNWKADYVLLVNDAETKGDLTGWVTLTNQSGAAFANARVQLVAGDVHRVAQDRPDLRMAAEYAVARASAPQFAEESLLEYHLYTLQRPATLLDQEQKQITLLEADGVSVAKRLIYRGEEGYFRGQLGEPMGNQKVGVFLDLENREANGLGIPLPKGVVRVYKADKSGGRQFVGEDAIDHTPRDEKVRVRIGEAFDLVGERRQTEWKVLGRCTSESSWKIELRNHKDEAAEIEVIEPAGGDWEILSSSHPATKDDVHSFRFKLKVPARGVETITYRVRVRWC